MLDDTIELLTIQMLEERFKDNTQLIIDKINLYKFCIDLVKLIKKVEME